MRKNMELSLKSLKDESRGDSGNKNEPEINEGIKNFQI